MSLQLREDSLEKLDFTQVDSNFSFIDKKQVSVPRAPTVNDDASMDYIVGNVLWIDTRDQAHYVLEDNTVGAAIWSTQAYIIQDKETFLELDDTPSEYERLMALGSTSDSIELIETPTSYLTGLPDMPPKYKGHALQAVVANITEDGLKFGYVQSAGSAQDIFVSSGSPDNLLGKDDDMWFELNTVLATEKYITSSIYTSIKIQDNSIGKRGDINYLVAASSEANASLRPITGDYSIETDEDTAIEISYQDLVASSISPVSKALHIESVFDNVHCNLEILTNSVIVTPHNNYYGTASFSFIVSDGTLEATGQAIVEVLREIDPRRIGHLDIQTNEDTILVLSEADLLLLFESPTGAALEISSSVHIWNQNTGSVSFNTTTRELIVTPKVNYSGEIKVSFYAMNVADHSIYCRGANWDAITIVAVNDAPLANDFSLYTRRLNLQGRIAIEDIKSHASDQETNREDLVVDIVSSSIGTVTLVDENYLLTPPLDYLGPVVLNYSISDGEDIAYAEISYDYIDPTLRASVETADAQYLPANYNWIDRDVIVTTAKDATGSTIELEFKTAQDGLTFDVRLLISDLPVGRAFLSFDLELLHTGMEAIALGSRFIYPFGATELDLYIDNEYVSSGNGYIGGPVHAGVHNYVYSLQTNSFIYLSLSLFFNCSANATIYFKISNIKVYV